MLINCKGKIHCVYVGGLQASVLAGCSTWAGLWAIVPLCLIMEDDHSGSVHYHGSRCH
jgi:hypothetical protein